MYKTIDKGGNVYICETYRKESGKHSTRIVKRLGKLPAIMAEHNFTEQEADEWINGEIKRLEEEQAAKKAEEDVVWVRFPKNHRLEVGYKPNTQVGDLFLQRVLTTIGLPQIIEQCAREEDLAFDLNKAVSYLVIDHILKTVPDNNTGLQTDTSFEPYHFSERHLSQALAVLAKNMDFIQEQLYKNCCELTGQNPEDASTTHFVPDEFFFLRAHDTTKEHSLANSSIDSVELDFRMDKKGIPATMNVYLNHEASPEPESSKGRQTKAVTDGLRRIKRELNADTFIYDKKDLSKKTESDESIKGRFVTGYISLVARRMLELIMKDDFWAEGLVETLAGMKVINLHGQGYSCNFKPTEITTKLIKTFEMPVDGQFISKSQIQAMVKRSREKMTNLKLPL